MIEQNLNDKRNQIVSACQEFGVARLQVFGSAATGRFDPSTSDYDFLVEWAPTIPLSRRPYLGLRQTLAKILGATVDIVDNATIKNPYFAIAARSEAVPLYG